MPTLSEHYHLALRNLMNNPRGISRHRHPVIRRAYQRIHQTELKDSYLIR